MFKCYFSFFLLSLLMGCSHGNDVPGGQLKVYESGRVELNVSSPNSSSAHTAFKSIEPTEEFKAAMKKVVGDKDIEYGTVRINEFTVRVAVYVNRGKWQYVDGERLVNLKPKTVYVFESVGEKSPE